VPKHPFPRRLIKNLENLDLPLLALTAVRELRSYLDEVEADALRSAKDLGASADDIAQALGITRQGTYYKLRNLGNR
jgi:transcriptional regulator with PAS, ATPase and Fis domain